MAAWSVESVSANTIESWADQRVALWPDEDAQQLRAEASAFLAKDAGRFATFVARAATGEVAGFAEGSIRHDYVNGTESSPVVFLEGIFVLSEHRRQGIAAALAAAVGEWGRAHGCVEFASDALIDNHASHAFHAAIGFVERERVVCFSRPL